MSKAFITGLSGPTLTDAEARFLAAARPAGIILFARNCETPDQVRRLVGDARNAIGAEQVLVLIDQEGGRVQRLRPPHWREMPAADAYLRSTNGRLDEAARRARIDAASIAAELTSLGINTNCAPVLDRPVAGSHDIIGSRAYAHEVEAIVAMARAVADGYIGGGVLPVIKHIPGHGRATADSHLELPVVATPRSELDATDFAPFWALSTLPAAMTAHVVYSAIDPDSPASTSRTVTIEVIRGAIGFGGLLISDDLSMRALSGTLAQRTTAVLAAGSDLALHCNGEMAEMEAVAAAAGPLAGRARARFARAFAVTTRQFSI